MAATESLPESLRRLARQRGIPAFMRETYIDSADRAERFAGWFAEQIALDLERLFPGQVRRIRPDATKATNAVDKRILEQETLGYYAPCPWCRHTGARDSTRAAVWIDAREGTAECGWCRAGTSEIVSLRRRPELLAELIVGDYFKSPEWRQTARRAIARAGNQCEICLGSDELWPVHRNVDLRGRERDEDLYVLCKRCRQEHGGDLRRKRTG